MLAKLVLDEGWSDLNDLRRVEKVRSSRVKRQIMRGRGAGDLEISL